MQLIERGKYRYFPSPEKAEDFREKLIDAYTERHQRIIEKALKEGKPVPSKVLTEYPELREPDPTLERILRQKEGMRKRYATLFGTRVKVGEQTWELVDVNDIGVPYWVKVVRGKAQKRKFTLSQYDRDWLEKQLEEKGIPKAHRAKPLPPEAENVQSLPFDSKEYDCYGKPTRRGYRVYCRRK